MCGQLLPDKVETKFETTFYYDPGIGNETIVARDIVK